MDIEDIEIGEEYAVSCTAKFQRIRVTDIEDGEIKGRRISRFGGGESDVRTYNADEFRRTWEDYKRQYNERKERKEATLDKQERVFAALKKLEGFDTETDSLGDERAKFEDVFAGVMFSGDGKVRMSYDRFLELLDAIEETS